MNEAQAAEMLALLRAIAVKLGARVPRPQTSPTDLEGWKQVSREFSAINRRPEPDPESGPPAAGGTPPEAVMRRRGV